MSTTYEQLVGILTRLHDAPADRIRPEATLGALDVDSLTTVEISIRIERDLGVSVKDDELEPDLTLCDIAGLIDARRATV
ncbi:acyl carrier protein [Streptomyces caniscabiei]|uniref:Acyl carrier protein n=1 Tax=Streptomyces caniscabiei TaxID=2746961 RepID=A0A927KZD3_9ACTN|nr:acyl carrier protein [Streptomyces caniscabiei]MBD9722524.1 acyl carrier protein [Streptomyces caniscabiei]MDX3515197.1 acyl carrier protein [Streptomyces caniscabiei]MDX3716521.1 acyl carrier protein [Streptomyces caniscabiei]WEO22417.1 acyl carrier protein [Streptomyces caniscabiei]